jgi:hypothetical protein
LEETPEKVWEADAVKLRLGFTEGPLNTPQEVGGPIGYEPNLTPWMYGEGDRSPNLLRVLKGPIMDPKREPIPKPAKVMEED